MRSVESGIMSHDSRLTLVVSSIGVRLFVDGEPLSYVSSFSVTNSWNPSVEIELARGIRAEDINLLPTSTKEAIQHTKDLLSKIPGIEI